MSGDDFSDVKVEVIDPQLSIVNWPFAEADLLSSCRQYLPQPLRRACRNGACGVCRCRLISGEIDYGSRFPYGLWQHEIDDGYILPCIAKPISDVRLGELNYDIIKGKKNREPDNA